MKKKQLGIIAAVCALVSVANADINVRWQGLDGFLQNDDATGILEPISGATAYAQLIYTPVNAYGANDTTIIGGGVAANESILGTYVITDSAGTDPYGVLAPQFTAPGTPFQAGFIYVRVFDGGTGNPANIVAGTWYYNGPIVATIDNITPANPDVYNANGANTSVAFGVGDVLNLQVVPEPSTLAFLGIGGLVLAIRRRKA
jgi:hypothetical protein